jgi:hypothetical protein
MDLVATLYAQKKQNGTMPQGVESDCYCVLVAFLVSELGVCYLCIRRVAL